jgi:hypothetical protein
VASSSLAPPPAATNVIPPAATTLMTPCNCSYFSLHVPCIASATKRNCWYMADCRGHLHNLFYSHATSDV